MEKLALILLSVAKHKRKISILNKINIAEEIDYQMLADINLTIREKEHQIAADSGTEMNKFNLQEISVKSYSKAFRR